MSLLNLIGWSRGGGSIPANELPEIFPMSILSTDFIRVDVETIYQRILTDVLERTEGIDEDHEELLWDNCLGTEANKGLVTKLACAMAEKRDLYLIFDKSTNVIREAKEEEKEEIRTSVKAGKDLSGKAYITFTQYKRTDMLRLYSALEYFAVSAIYKGMGTSKAAQFKMFNLRQGVSTVDAADVITQAQTMATGLAKGRDILMDKEDHIEFAKLDLSSTSTALEFIEKKKAHYLGLPASWNTGEAKNSMGDTGEGDSRKLDQGLKIYYFSIIKPVLKQLLGEEDLKFRSDDFRNLSTALEALKTFEVTSNDHLSAENKTKVINSLFGLPEDEEGDPPEPAPQIPAPVPGQPPGQVPPKPPVAPGQKPPAA